MRWREPRRGCGREPPAGGRETGRKGAREGGPAVQRHTVPDAATRAWPLRPRAGAVPERDAAAHYPTCHCTDLSRSAQADPHRHSLLQSLAPSPRWPAGGSLSAPGSTRRGPSRLQCRTAADVARGQAAASSPPAARQPRAWGQGPARRARRRGTPPEAARQPHPHRGRAAGARGRAAAHRSTVAVAVPAA